MNKEDIKVEVLRNPTIDDWARCKMLALNTVGKNYTGNEVTESWKKSILKAGHSPIRTLMFTIRLEIPYYVSVHFVRHKHGIEHYVTSQRNDRQNKYDRELAPQSAMVTHIIDVNADELIFMANRRLCSQADITTRYVMSKICMEVLRLNPEFKDFLVPMCERVHECKEFKSCGHYDRIKAIENDPFEDDLK